MTPFEITQTRFFYLLGLLSLLSSAVSALPSLYLHLSGLKTICCPRNQITDFLTFGQGSIAVTLEIVRCLIQQRSV